MKRLGPAALLLVLTAGTARAADVVADAAAPDERAVLAELGTQQYIKARDDAEKILAANPDSFVANWAMARVQHDEEGNHARALYYIKRAEQLLTKQFATDPEWHKKVLLEHYWILLEINQNAKAVAVLDRAEELYGTFHVDLRIWPLFKIGRAEEARAIARKLAESEDWNDRARGYNGMLAIEFEAHDRNAAYRWAMAGVQATQERSCIILRNAAGTAFTRLKLAEAEDLALKAHKAEFKDCTHSGYDLLAGIYIFEGEFQKALSAIETLKKERIEKRYRPHYALTRRMILADLLSALGKVEDAERMAAELYGLPERTGMTSSSVEVERFARSYRYLMTLDARIALERERASMRTFFASFPTEAIRLGIARWEVGQALLMLAAQPDMLVSLVRPNLGEINDWSAWKAGGLITTVGLGTMRSAIESARRLDADYTEAPPYLDALAGEVAYRAGELVNADQLARKALATLPKEEALLRWRTEAWQADALRRLGRATEAWPLYHDVLQHFPSVLRVLDVPLPAKLTVDGGGLAATVGRRLRNSTRFEIDDTAPFRIAVGPSGATVEICLIDDGGSQIACTRGANKDDDKDKKTDEKPLSEEETVQTALDAFHAAAFSPKVSLKQSDLNSLDGSPVRVGADEVLKGVFQP